MSECWDEGGLRAYFDRELPAEDLARVAAHLGACAECHTRYNQLAARATQVSSLMGALTVETSVAPTAMPSKPSKRRWVQPVAAAALALAASAALAFVLIPKRVEPPQPVARPRIERVNRPIQAEAPVPEAPALKLGLQPGLKPAAPVRVSHSRPAARAKAPQKDYYLALDDEPIDVGVVMRVALDSAAAVQADVIFDAAGRPRAIRPVK